MFQPPVDHVHLYPWEDRAGQPVSEFIGRVWALPNIEVAVVGVQTLDGEQRRVVVGNGAELDAGEVGQLAGAHGAVVEPQHGQDRLSTGRETRGDLRGEGATASRVSAPAARIAT